MNCDMCLTSLTEWESTVKGPLCELGTQDVTIQNILLDITYNFLHGNWSVSCFVNSSKYPNF